MKSNLPEGARSAYARQLADEAKTLVPGMERLAEIAAELRADDLYRTLGFDTWERFCVDYLGVSKRTANRWIAGSEPKSITAGQRVAAGQNVPVVESTALKSPASATPAKKLEGVDPRTTPPLDLPTSFPPSDHSPVGGNALGEVSAPPAAVPPEVPGSSDPAFQRPLNPPELVASGRPPTDRALTARVFAAMRDVDPIDAGPVTTPEEATFLRQWAQRTLDAWKAKNVPVVAPRPAGRVIKPGDRKAKAEALTPYKAPKVKQPVSPILPVRAPDLPLRGKRHADDCSCLSCAPPKVAKR